MSKLSASEFRTWESLYWPDHIPRILDVSNYIPDGKIVSELRTDWLFKSKRYSITSDKFARLVDSIVRPLDRDPKPSIVALIGIDPINVVLAVALSFRTGISTEILYDPAKMGNTRSIVVTERGETNDLEQGIKVEASEAVASSVWEPSESSVSILFPEEARATYTLRELWAAIESFLAFTNLRTEKGVAVLGSSRREFGFFATVSTLVSGVPLILVEDISDLFHLLDRRISVLFVGSDVIRAAERNLVEELTKLLRVFRSSLSFVGMEGPLGSDLTRGIEKAIGVPALQMFGVSGRGIVFSNPKEFNVHGSLGIPITNVEAIIADNYEGNWTRDRILMGPGTEGELVVRSPFIDGMKDVGDARQNPVKANILGQSTDWVTTGITAKMDENGYFYLKDSSFK